MRLVAAGIGAVMRLSSCSCRQSLNVRIADVAVAMVWAFLLGDSLEDGQAPADNRRHLSLLQKMLGETLPALPSLQA